MLAAEWMEGTGWDRMGLAEASLPTTLQHAAAAHCARSASILDGDWCSMVRKVGWASSRKAGTESVPLM